MTPEILPYRHEIAVGSEWLLDALRRSVDSYREQLELRLSVAEQTGNVTLFRDLTRELVLVTAAQEQLNTEENLHS